MPFLGVNSNVCESPVNDVASAEDDFCRYARPVRSVATECCGVHFGSEENAICQDTNVRGKPATVSENGTEPSVDVRRVRAHVTGTCRKRKLAGWFFPVHYVHLS